MFIAEGKGVHLFLYVVIVIFESGDLLIQLLYCHTILIHLALHFSVLLLYLFSPLLQLRNALAELLIFAFDASVYECVVPDFIDLQFLENLFLLGLVTAEFFLYPLLFLARLQHQVGQLLTLLGGCSEFFPEGIVFFFEFFDGGEDIFDFNVVFEVVLYFLDFAHEIALHLNVHADDPVDVVPLFFPLQQQKEHNFNHFLQRLIFHHALTVAPRQSFPLHLQQVALEREEVGSELEGQVVQLAEVVVVDAEEQFIEEGRGAKLFEVVEAGGVPPIQQLLGSPLQEKGRVVIIVHHAFLVIKIIL